MSEYNPNKTKRTHIFRLLPMLHVFAELVAGQPESMAPRSVSDVGGVDLELFRKENRLRSGLRSALASMKPVLQELISKSSNIGDAYGILYECVELRGFPPLMAMERVRVDYFTDKMRRLNYF